MTSSIKFTSGPTATMSKAEQDMIRNPMRIDPITAQKQVTAEVRSLRHRARPSGQTILHSVLFSCDVPGLIPNDMLELYLKDEDSMKDYPVGGTYTAVILTAPGAPVIIISLTPKV